MSNNQSVFNLSFYVYRYGIPKECDVVNVIHLTTDVVPNLVFCDMFCICKFYFMSFTFISVSHLSYIACKFPCVGPIKLILSYYVVVYVQAKEETTQCHTPKAGGTFNCKGRPVWESNMNIHMFQMLLVIWYFHGFCNPLNMIWSD